MKPDQHDLIISWQSFHQHCRELAQQLSQLGAFKGIIAVTRGGLVPAAIVASELDIRMIDTYCLSSYAEKKQTRINCLKPTSVAGNGSNWLIIDDLADSGKTSQYIKAQLPESHLATVYVKPQGKPWVNSFVNEVSQQTWIHLPWEQHKEIQDSVEPKKS